MEEKSFESEHFVETEKVITGSLTPTQLVDKETWKRIFKRRDLEGVTLGFLLAFFYFKQKFLISTDSEEITHWVFHEQEGTLPPCDEIFFHYLRCLLNMTRN